MVCAVRDLSTWVKIVMYDHFDVSKSNNIILRYQDAEINYDTTLLLLSKIDPHIYAFCEAIGSGGGSTPRATTSGVYCKCSASYDDGGEVNPTPVAGGIGLDYETEYIKCMNDLNVGEDYYFTRTGKSTECLYLNYAAHTFFCVQSLTGKLATTCGD